MQRGVDGVAASRRGVRILKTSVRRQAASPRSKKFNDRRTTHNLARDTIICAAQLSDCAVSCISSLKQF